VQRTERRKRINRSARWALSICTVFGILVPFSALQFVDPPPPSYSFVAELQGEPRTTIVSVKQAGGEFKNEAGVSYLFPRSKESLVSLLQERLKAPEWTEWNAPDQGFVFFNRNGDQIVVHSRGESACQAYINIKNNDP
jgi:hypothetical protein